MIGDRIKCIKVSGCVSWEFGESCQPCLSSSASPLLSLLIKKLDQKGRNISRVQLELLPLGPDASLPGQPLITLIINVHIRDMLQCLERYPSTETANQSCCGNLAAAQRTDNNRMSFILGGRVGGLAEAARGQN